MKSTPRQDRIERVLEYDDGTVGEQPRKCNTVGWKDLRIIRRGVGVGVVQAHIIEGNDLENGNTVSRLENSQNWGGAFGVSVGAGVGGVVQAVKRGGQRHQHQTSMNQ